jgi:hypothetical protein
VEKGNGFAVVSAWGRRGTRYQTLIKDFPTIEAALDYYARKGAEKSRKGYGDIPVDAWGLARRLESAFPGAGTPPPALPTQPQSSPPTPPPTPEQTPADRRGGGSILILDPPRDRQRSDP